MGNQQQACLTSCAPYESPIVEQSESPTMHSMDAITAQFLEYQSKEKKLKQSHHKREPRVIFVSLLHFVSEWRQIPFNVLVNCLLIFNVRRRWVLKPTTADSHHYSEENIESMEDIIAYRRYQKLVDCDLIDHDVLSILRQKDKQGFVFWALDNGASSDTPQSRSYSSSSTLSLPSPLHMIGGGGDSSSHPLMSSPPMGDTNGVFLPSSELNENISDISSLPPPPINFGQSGGCGRINIDSIAGINISGSNSRRSSGRFEVIHSKWQSLNDWITNIYDPIAAENYRSLALESSFWQRKFDFLEWAIRNGNKRVLDRCWQHVFCQIEHCSDIDQIRKELEEFKFRYRAIMEILHQSNPTCIPMINYSPKLFSIKFLEIIQFFPSESDSNSNGSGSRRPSVVSKKNRRPSKDFKLSLSAMSSSSASSKVSISNHHDKKPLVLDRRPLIRISRVKKLSVPIAVADDDGFVYLE